MAPRLGGALLCALALATPVAAERFAVDGPALSYDTAFPGPDGRDHRIVDADVAELRTLLRDHPDVRIVFLNSEGGGYFAAFDMAAVIADFGLATVVVDECASSCAYVFLGGVERRMLRGGRIGFHRTSWSADAIEGFYGDRAAGNGWATPFAMTAWVYEDTQAEVFDRLTFMVERGVAPGFAIRTLEAPSEGMWYPTRDELRAAGMLTE
ncbi:MAG: hypothetical protein ACU0CO_02375 [Shimia sp.]